MEWKWSGSFSGVKWKPRFEILPVCLALLSVLRHFQTGLWFEYDDLHNSPGTQLLGIRFLLLANRFGGYCRDGVPPPFHLLVYHGYCLNRVPGALPVDKEFGLLGMSARMLWLWPNVGALWASTTVL